MKFLISLIVLAVTFMATFIFGIYYYILVPVMGIYLVVMGIPELKEIYRYTRNPEKEKKGIKTFYLMLIFLPFIIFRSRELNSHVGDMLTTYYSVLLIITFLVPKYNVILKPIINFISKIVEAIRETSKALFDAYFK